MAEVQEWDILFIALLVITTLVLCVAYKRYQTAPVFADALVTTLGLISLLAQYGDTGMAIEH